MTAKRSLRRCSRSIDLDDCPSVPEKANADITLAINDTSTASILSDARTVSGERATIIKTWRIHTQHTPASRPIVAHILLMFLHLRCQPLDNMTY